VTEYAINRYLARNPECADSTVGFLRTLQSDTLTDEQIDTIVANAQKMAGGAFDGVGDRFKAWSLRYGTVVPESDIVSALNRNQTDGALLIRKAIPENPLLWRNWCSFTSGKGRRSV